MNPHRTALVSSVATVVVWTAKALAIGIAGGLGSSPAEGPLFLAGLVCCVVAAVATGVALTAGRSRAVRVLGGIAGFVVTAVLGTLAQSVVSAVQPAHPAWAWGEVNLWVMGLALLGVNLARRQVSRRPEPTRVTASAA
jgi:hypothetical protein